MKICGIARSRHNAKPFISCLADRVRKLEIIVYIRRAKHVVNNNFQMVPRFILGFRQRLDFQMIMRSVFHKSDMVIIRVAYLRVRPCIQFNAVTFTSRKA